MQPPTSEYGTPDVLEISEVERPTIGPRQVLVRVHASAVTQGDRRLRSADFPGMSAVFGRLMMGVFRPRHTIGGSTFAGRVVEVGAEVTRFSVGDDIFGTVMHGAYAEYLAVNETDPVATMPTELGYAEAASLPYGAGTALLLPSRPGEGPAGRARADRRRLGRRRAGWRFRSPSTSAPTSPAC